MTQDQNSPIVELFWDGDKWIVRIAESGASSTHTFEMQSYAQSYAEGQRLRLGLDAYQSRSDSVSPV